ncbi:STAS/SEC14 domain-containing protein [Aquiflexum sp. TKW24L]|uniref:STAS/SEC14 domain-containing protein n=1 Tax=Aquiflexum sp. TKW24L TaxID=2942212 RepID=UPI0020BF7D7C|nr:STAS/SEC14 domain-containing protein [Aquiflexum sp. TKW24L]MCL6260143.1 STAS/SEC14 domain-containing protein [Aquiflexum sp. TKW24L]
MDSFAIIDESDFPVIRIRFTGKKSTDQNFQTYLDQTKACYRFAKQLAIIFDASDAAIPSLSHQKMQANWLKENEQLMKDFCAGTAYILPNAVIRAILKMIFSFQKQPVPYKIFESEPEANTWVNGLDLDRNSTT